MFRYIGNLPRHFNWNMQAWKSCLSESERNFLKQFLPREAEAKEVVKSLLSGDNFHFGNPLIKWLALI